MITNMRLFFFSRLFVVSWAVVCGGGASAQTPASLSETKPRLTQPATVGSTFTLQHNGNTNVASVLELSTNLSSWKPLAFANTVRPQTIFTTAFTTDFPAVFFRTAEYPVAQSVSTNYHGWTDAVVLRNARAEVVVVPAISRIMQFRLLSSEDGPFWENQSMEGRQPSANDWNNPGSFGGDKTWPAPQSVWNWPPPRAYDSISATAQVANGAIELTAPMDKLFGIRARRRIELHPTEPVLRVTTTFEKITSGTAKPDTVAVWTITQLKEPQRMYLVVPQPSIFPKGYTLLDSSAPPGILVTNGFVSFNYHSSQSHKIGSDSLTLIWAGADFTLRMDSTRMAGLPRSAFADSGSSSEVYINPEPARYVEFEFLSHLKTLAPGEELTLVCIYSLFARTESSPDAEALKVSGRVALPNGANDGEQQ